MREISDRQNLPQGHFSENRQKPPVGPHLAGNPIPTSGSFSSRSSGAALFRLHSRRGSASIFERTSSVPFIEKLNRPKRSSPTTPARWWLRRAARRTRPSPAPNFPNADRVERDQFAFELVPAGNFHLHGQGGRVDLDAAFHRQLVGQDDRAVPVSTTISTACPFTTTEA